MNNRRIILPVILILSLIFSSWAYAPSAIVKEQTSVINQLTQEIVKIEQLPAGSQFTLTLSDADLTKAAEEGLAAYKTEIEQMIKQYAGVGIQVSDPKVSFSPEGFKLSLKAGKGFVKITASATGTVGIQNELPVVTLSSVDVPIISVPVADANTMIQSYITRYFGVVSANYSIQSIETKDGQIVATGTKK